MFNKYSEYYERFNQSKPYKKEIKFVYNWSDKPKSILDIGCGTANYWKYYPKSVELIGIEKSVDMISQSAYKNNINCDDILTYKPNYGYADMPYDPTVDLVTALFDVINYLPKHNWWKNLPIKKGGYFIFDIWDTEKIKRDGFRETIKTRNNITRTIYPMKQTKKFVDLKITVTDGIWRFTEDHRMYLYSLLDIKKFCSKEFEIEEVVYTRNWQTWIKCKRK